jgi:hypothetical protein
MSDILDLDALAPEVKKVKIAGKIIDCYPPKVLQLIKMQKIWEKMQGGKLTSAEAIQGLKEALTPIVPAIKNDDDIDFSIEQLTALLRFAQGTAIPDSNAEKMPEQPKKKITSQGQSHTSSSTIKPTQ